MRITFLTVTLKKRMRLSINQFQNKDEPQDQPVKERQECGTYEYTAQGWRICGQDHQNQRSSWTNRIMSLIKSIDFQFESMISFLFSDTAPSPHAHILCLHLNFFCFLSKCLLEVKKSHACAHISPFCTQKCRSHSNVPSACSGLIVCALRSKWMHSEHTSAHRSSSALGSLLCSRIHTELMVYQVLEVEILLQYFFAPIYTFNASISRSSGALNINIKETRSQ